MDEAIATIWTLTTTDCVLSKRHAKVATYCLTPGNSHCLTQANLFWAPSCYVGSIMDKKFSIGILIITTIITALISGTIGTFLDDFFNRAKPSISLLSVGFQAPSQNDSVRLPDELSRTSKQAHWAISLERFEPFTHVIEVEQRDRTWIQQANEFIANLEEWKNKFIARPNNTYPVGDTLSANAILSHPYLSSDYGGEVITVLLRRGSMGKVTYSDHDVTSLAPIVEVSDQKDQQRWVFFMAYKAQLLPYKDASDFAKKAIDLFAESFARGVTQNVLEYTDYAISLTRKDILDAQRLSVGMQDAILPDATIATTIALRNAGKTPITFSPYFGLKIDHPDYQDKNIVLVSVETDGGKKENPFTLTSNGFMINLGDKEKKGEAAKVEPFLPNAGDTHYITIGAGETVRAKLVGTTALGTKAKSLVEMHATKLLRARILGLADAGREVWSEWTPFSLQVDETIRKRLESATP
jgi:hypothetical protein